MTRVPGLVVLALLLGLTGWSVASLQPPSAQPASAPAADFSAGRADAHVEALAGRPHAAGSAADDAVTDSLVATLTGYGLQTQVQRAVGAQAEGRGAVGMAAVRNVVAVLPGTKPTGRLFLMAHHDSVQNGPGASDDTGGVAAVLETVRALTAGPRPRNDVVVVLTDAEEACLCGAEAFAADHPLAVGGGVVLNLEARGTGGPPITFETSAGNAALAARYAAVVPHPVASSVAVEVYRALPNDTDFTPMLAAGFTGLNTAWIDGAAAYHTAEDTPARLDRGSLQALGDNTLALARALGDDDLRPLARPASSDATYFPVLGRLAHWPGRLVWPLAVAALLAVAVLALVLRRRGISSLSRTAAATALTVVPLVLAPVAAQGVRALLVALRPGYAAMLDPWHPGWFRLAAVALVAVVVLGWYALLRRRIGAAALATGALVWLAVLGVALAALAPGGSYLGAVPALAGALTGLAGVLLRPPAARAGTALVGGAVAVLVLAPTVALFFPALGLRTAAAPGLLTGLLALALLPAVELLLPAAGAPRARWGAVLVPGTALVLAVAGTGTGLAVDRFDPGHPVPSQLTYALDADSGRAWWASTEQQPGAFTGRYVHGRTPVPVAFPYLDGADVATGTARPAALPAPVVTSADQRVVGARREITVRAASRRQVRQLAFDLRATGGRITEARVQGTEIPPAALGGDRLRVVFSGPPAGGVEALFTVEGGAAPSLRITDASDGLDGLPGYTPRPADVGAAGAHTSDLVMVSATAPLPEPGGPSR